MYVGGARTGNGDGSGAKIQGMGGTHREVELSEPAGVHQLPLLVHRFDHLRIGGLAAGLGGVVGQPTLALVRFAAAIRRANEVAVDLVPVEMPKQTPNKRTSQPKRYLSPARVIGARTAGSRSHHGHARVKERGGKGGMTQVRSNVNVPNRHPFAWVCAVETLKVARARHEKDRVFDVVICVARWSLGRWMQLPGL